MQRQLTKHYDEIKAGRDAQKRVSHVTAHCPSLTLQYFVLPLDLSSFEMQTKTCKSMLFISTRGSGISSCPVCGRMFGRTGRGRFAVAALYRCAPRLIETGCPV